MWQRSQARLRDSVTGDFDASFQARQRIGSSGAGSWVVEPFTSQICARAGTLSPAAPTMGSYLSFVYSTLSSFCLGSATADAMPLPLPGPACGRPSPVWLGLLVGASGQDYTACPAVLTVD